MAKWDDGAIAGLRELQTATGFEVQWNENVR